MGERYQQHKYEEKEGRALLTWSKEGKREEGPPPIIGR